MFCLFGFGFCEAVPEEVSATIQNGWRPLCFFGSRLEIGSHCHEPDAHINVSLAGALRTNGQNEFAKDQSPS